MRAAYLLGALLLSVSAIFPVAQNVNTEHPTEINAQHPPTPEERRSRAGHAQLQKDAKELSELCRAMPAELEAVQQGMLPKDMSDRLNRVEKLAKRVRQELSAE